MFKGPCGCSLRGVRTARSLANFFPINRYAVPLMEIDFTRCRKCTPSYRALPRDYPNPPCSERSEEEKKVLNNVWVSLPVGSEEVSERSER